MCGRRLSLLLYEFTREAIKLIVVIHEVSLLTTSYKILSNILLSRLSPYLSLSLSACVRLYVCGREREEKNYW
jgi:hypothetical protein